MSHPAPEPASEPAVAGGAPEDVRDDPPPSGAEQVEERDPPVTEAQRQAQETVRAVSRLEESN